MTNQGDIVPVTIPRPDHVISRANISSSALKVLYRLKDAGFQSFLVGGGVRDLLLGREPKDFDVGTNATPDEIKGLFTTEEIKRGTVITVCPGHFEAKGFRPHASRDNVNYAFTLRSKHFEHLLFVLDDVVVTGFARSDLCQGAQINDLVLPQAHHNFCLSDLCPCTIFWKYRANVVFTFDYAGGAAQQCRVQGDLVV